MIIDLLDTLGFKPIIKLPSPYKLEITKAKLIAPVLKIVNWLQTKGTPGRRAYKNFIPVVDKLKTLIN